MKFKFIAVFSIIILCSVVAFSQERNYELEVYLEDSAIQKVEKQTFATVTITNKSEKVLRTAGLNNVHFYFSKCLLGTPCDKNDDVYVGIFKIPSKRLRENNSFKFRVNLADLYWKDAQINISYTEDVKNFNVVPNKNIYFYAGIKTLEGYKMKNYGPRYDKNGKFTRVIVRKTPVYKVVNSNVIVTTLD